jgi:hypothetical protein
MKVAANFIIALTALACLVALAISIYPGVLNDLLFIGIFLSFLVVPVLGLVALVGVIVLARKASCAGCEYRGRGRRSSWRSCSGRTSC